MWFHSKKYYANRVDELQEKLNKFQAEVYQSEVSKRFEDDIKNLNCELSIERNKNEVLNGTNHLLSETIGRISKK